VIVQAEVAIEAGDTEQILHERIKRVEHELLGSTIEQLAYKQKPVLRVES
jgi:folate-dependent phosphoribosylglycinamide formyltransferase PurN